MEGIAQVGENTDQPEHLDDEEGDILDKQITEEEVEKVVKDLGRGKPWVKMIYLANCIELYKFQSIQMIRLHSLS